MTQRTRKIILAIGKIITFLATAIFFISCGSMIELQSVENPYLTASIISGAWLAFVTWLTY